MGKLVTYFILGVSGVVLVAGISIIYAFPLMWCWNHVIPTLFGLKTINWTQAWCLMFVASCLIKSTQTVAK